LKGLAFHLDADLRSPCLVVGDQAKLRQVLINLLGNAVKFTAQGEVVLRVEAEAEHRYAFEVADTGPGIAAETQARLFEPFHQGEAGRHQGGTGLGLAISKRQVELMGGRMNVDSVPGEGCSFYFGLPLPPAPGAQEPAPPLRRRQHLAPGQSATALVVDDVKLNRDILAHMLTDIGLAVRQAADGQEALEAVAQERPDIVFMDIRMPRLDGMAAVAALRLSYGLACPPCVAITASTLVHEVRTYRNAGFCDYIAKPFRFERVYQTLEHWLGLTLVGEAAGVGAESHRGTELG
jgi:CheY-like chemotaxis protein